MNGGKVKKMRMGGNTLVRMKLKNWAELMLEETLIEMTWLKKDVL